MYKDNRLNGALSEVIDKNCLENERKTSHRVP